MKRETKRRNMVKGFLFMALLSMTGTLGAQTWTNTWIDVKDELENVPNMEIYALALVPPSPAPSSQQVIEIAMGAGIRFAFKRCRRYIEGSFRGQRRFFRVGSEEGKP